MRSIPLIVRHATWGLLVAGLVSGCGKAQEAAGEKITEKMIESAISKDGGSAKVDIGKEGAVKAEGVDKDGKAYKIEMGQADVTEKEIGLAFYPGAKPEKGNRMANGDSQMSQVELVSSDSVAKVTEWYRAQLKARPGKNEQSMEQVTADSAMLMAGDAAGVDSLVININKEGDSGSRVSLMHGAKLR